MKKRWVQTWRVPPPSGQTILARYGGSWCFVAYKRFLNVWLLIANGTQHDIAEPPEWWCDEDYEREHEIKNAKPPINQSHQMRPRKRGQLQLGI
jgi:hypothetical protein